MISISEVIQIQKILIEEFGGSPGIRDYDLLESALSRPYATYDGMELYPTILEKASAILESLCINHPFVDGNKRIAYTVYRLLLLSEGADVAASEDEKYKLVIAVSSGNADFDSILQWTKDHSV